MRGVDWRPGVPLRPFVADRCPATWSEALDATLVRSTAWSVSAHTVMILRDIVPWSSRHRGPVTGRGLAGLGCAGDDSCVPVFLAAIRDAAPRLVGMDALRALLEKASPGPGRRHPSCQAQLALIPVLGARRDPVAPPLLEQLAQSKPTYRFAALEATGDSDLPRR